MWHSHRSVTLSSSSWAIRWPTFSVTPSTPHAPHSPSAMSTPSPSASTLASAALECKCWSCLELLAYLTSSCCYFLQQSSKGGWHSCPVNLPSSHLGFLGLSCYTTSILYTRWMEVCLSQNYWESYPVPKQALPMYEYHKREGHRSS